jgi:hypothetical protein
LPKNHTPESTTLILAIIRGLMLDLLATGDRQRIDLAFALANLMFLEYVNDNMDYKAQIRRKQ